MRKLLTFKPHVRFKSTYPLIQIEQLRKWKEIALGETATIPLRDYYEWLSLPSIMRHETFFTQRGNLPSYSPEYNENLLLYDPILTYCIAKWFLVDYKLNSYPYSDLNIINIYTDLPQSLKIAKSMMTYFQRVLSKEMFERIRYIMVPLHSHKQSPSKKLTSGIPGEVEIISNNAVFSAESSDMGDRVIEDPVYILMLNDVLKNTSHDLVRYSHEGQWEQCYMDINESGGRLQRFDTEMDYWCEIALKRIVGKSNPRLIKNAQHLYIPTRLVQLFEIIKRCAPAHKLFAIDTPQRWDPSFISMFKLLLGYEPLRGSKIQDVQGSSIWRGRRESVGPRFTVDFAQIQQLYTNINETSKMCEIEDLREFVDQWFDIGVELNKEFTRDKLESQLKVINGSQLAILHSC